MRQWNGDVEQHIEPIAIPCLPGPWLGNGLRRRRLGIGSLDDGDHSVDDLNERVRVMLRSNPSVDDLNEIS